MYNNYISTKKFEDLGKNWDLGKFLGFEKKFGILEKKIGKYITVLPPLIFPFFVIRGGKTVTISGDRHHTCTSAAMIECLISPVFSVSSNKNVQNR